MKHGIDITNTFNTQAHFNIQQMTYAPGNNEMDYKNDFFEWEESANIYIYYVIGLSNDLSPKSSGAWVQYNDVGSYWTDKPAGIYIQRSNAEIEDMIYTWLEQNEYPNKSRQVSEILKRYKSKKTISLNKFDIFDIEDPKLNLPNGVYHLTTHKLDPHSPEELYLKQMKVHLTESKKFDDAADVDTLIKIEERIPRWMSLKKNYPTVIGELERYLQMIFHRDYKGELIMQIVGSRNTGKSVTGKVFAKILDGVASFMDMTDIGSDWGMQGLVGNLVNIDLDARMGFYDKKTLGFIKKIIGDPGVPIKTRFIYSGFVEAIYSPFFIVLQNQYSQLPPQVDVDAWFKRNYCLVMDRKFAHNPIFEEELMNEIHDIFTYIILKPFDPIRKSIDFANPDGTQGMENFIAQNMEVWEIWSDPLTRIFKDHFEYSIDEDKTLFVEDIVDVFTDVLFAQNIKVNNIEDRIETLLKRNKIKLVKENDPRVNDKRVKVELYTHIVQTKKCKIKYDLIDPYLMYLSNETGIEELEEENSFDNLDIEDMIKNTKVKDKGGF